MHQYYHGRGTDLSVMRAEAQARAEGKFGMRDVEESIIHHHHKGDPCTDACEFVGPLVGEEPAEVG